MRGNVNKYLQIVQEANVAHRFQINRNVYIMQNRVALSSASQNQHHHMIGL